MEKNVGIIPLINPSAGCLSGWEWVLLVVATWSLITAPLFACYAPAAGFAVLPVEYVPSPLADCGQAGRRTSTDEVDAHFANLRGARRSTDASSSLLVDPAPPPPGGEWGDDDVESIGSDDAVPPPDI